MVTANLKKYNGENEKLSNDHSIEIDLNQHDLGLSDVYLRRGSKGYLLYILGINGEPSPFTHVNFNYEIDGVSEPIPSTLQTNK